MSKKMTYKRIIRKATRNGAPRGVKFNTEYVEQQIMRLVHKRGNIANREKLVMELLGALSLMKAYNEMSFELVVPKGEIKDAVIRIANRSI